MKYYPLSYIEISKKNLIHNIKQFKRIVRDGTKIVGVIKSNAYGHGDLEVVKILNSYVDFFQVNNIYELEKVVNVARKPILVLGYISRNDIKRAIEIGCVLSVFDLEHALYINGIAKKLKKKQKVHIAVDSHLGREGILPKDSATFINELKKMKNIKVDGVYAHFSNIEDTTDFSHANRQLKMYHEIIDQFKKAGFPYIKTHISATSGVLAYEKWYGYHNLVRIGIGLYGMWPSEDLKKVWQSKIKLLPVLRYISHIAQIKELEKGEPIGYGLTFVTKKKTKIAIIPQGYFDGINRLSSNNGSVLIKGMKANILGRIAMNMFVVDISDIKNVSTEDEVVIIGSQKTEIITPEQIAQNTQTINYEVTTRLSPLLPRIVI